MKIRTIAGMLLALGLATAGARADVMQFGDQNLLGTGTYPSDPTAGATLQGLAPGAVTVATNSFHHAFPFAPAPGAYPGTDQMYTMGAHSSTHDGYSVSSGAVNGPQVLTMDYGSVLPAGQKVGTLTLGLAADDFQQPTLHEPFVAKVNGVVDAALSNQLNSLNLGSPSVQFFTVGIDPSVLAPTHVLTLDIERAGAASDGWAVDFATVGVTAGPQAVPEPTTLSVLALGIAGLGIRSIRRRRPRPSAI